MNFITRVCDIIQELIPDANANRSFMHAYKRIFQVETDTDVYRALVLLDDQIQKTLQAFSQLTGEGSNEAKFLKQTLNILVSSSNLLINVQTHIQALLKAKDLLFSISKLYSEQNVKDDLDKIQTDLDAFLKSINTLDISQEEKMLYTEITLQLKKSIYFYSISGIKSLNIHLRAFGCITKDTKEGSSIYKKLSSIVELGSNASTIVDTITKYLPM